MTNKKELDEDAKNLLNLIYFILGLALIAGLSTIGFYLYHMKGPVSSDPAVWGTFGDFIGGTLNPFFSFLTIFTLLITIILQTRELKQTREQIELSKEELKKSSAALEAQSNTLKIQNFENTFFQMLKLHNDIVENIHTLQGKHTGRATFVIFFNELKSHFNSASKRNDLDQRQVVTEIYQKFHVNNQHLVGHYFRNLYQLIKLVSKNQSGEKKLQYLKIIQAQLSSFELLLLFYNGLNPIGSGFKKYIKEYGLLKHLDLDLLIRREVHEGFYNQSAYVEPEL